MSRVAVILSNMGGPDSISAVRPFLENIFNDPDIIDLPVPAFLRGRIVKWIVNKRAEESENIYRQIGGKTPLTETTIDQARRLQKLLNESGPDDYSVFVGMRYWKPYLEDVWQQIVESRFNKVIVFSHYPQYSTTTSGSIENQITSLINRNGHEPLDVEFIASYCDHPAYVHAVTDSIMPAMEKYIRSGEDVDLIMSAHGIPLSRIKKGDPYEKEVGRTYSAIRHVLPQNINMHQAWQSKVGPVKWLGPDIQDVLKTLAGQGKKRVIVYPISFITDNSETVYEIDILYRDLARKLGINEFERIRALNTTPQFIHAMAKIILHPEHGMVTRKIYG